MFITIPKPLWVFNMGGMTGAGGEDCFGKLVVSIEFSQRAIHYLRKYKPDYRVRHEVISTKQDGELTTEDRERLAEKIIECEGLEIMVLQGLDTIAETHEFLFDHRGVQAAISNQGKRVVIVAARHSICVKDSELPWSLATASSWLMYCGPGIYAVAHGHVFECNTYRMEPDGFIRRRWD